MSAQPLEARLAHVEGAFIQVGERLNSIDRRLDTMEQTMNKRFDQVEARFLQVDSRFALVDQRFNWLIGIVIGTWITTVAAWSSTLLTILLHR